MDRQSTELLEFPKVREILASYTSFSASREIALTIEPLSNHDQIILLLQQADEACRLLSLKPEFSIGGVTDIREIVGLTTKGKMLDAQALLTVKETLIALRELRSRFERQSGDVPMLWKIAQGIVEQKHIESKIRRCISPQGDILDNASDKLLDIRRKLREGRQRILERLDAFVKSEKGQKLLQEPLITEREGRYVLPVKTENKRDVKGIVHDISNTGSTVFIEPMVTIDMGNELRGLTVEEKLERERILSVLSGEIAEHAEEIKRSIDLTAELDFALTKARYAEKARASVPLIPQHDKKSASENPDARVLKLVNARHPLLKGAAVPLTVEIGRDFSTLIITGPNTGGKTVALKTIGLLVLMTQAGIPIPASPESSVPVFRDVFADIGDEQSIEHTLSTFSWHIGNINRILKALSGNCMVLMDELGTSTDPAEGAALAQAILLRLLKTKTIVVATTHFSELKAFAYKTPGIKNASLDFDPDTLKPTYHLSIGIPGGSNALSIASSLGLPEDIISSAKEMLSSSGTVEMEAVLHDLMSEKMKAEALQDKLSRRIQETEQLKDNLEQKKQVLEKMESDLLRQSKDRLLLEASQLQNMIKNVTAQLKKQQKLENIEKAKRALEQLHEHMDSSRWQRKIRAGQTAETPSISDLAVGQNVRLINESLAGTISSIAEKEGTVEVLAGGAKITVDISNIELVPEQQGKIKLSKHLSLERSSKSVPMELDLRGKRSSEVEGLIDSYLNDAFLAGLSSVRIIHGYGTGTVRQIVRELLASHTLVKSFTPGTKGEGGDGATNVNL
ncbi:MAG TPA: endonuclease MutS2 [Dehalococcoidia bacterium]|nr:endonuclease MutS2 [Dehalococcoidia bacterium]